MLALIDELAAFHLEYMAAQVLLVGAPLPRLERFFSAGFEFVETYPSLDKKGIINFVAPGCVFRACSSQTPGRR